MKINNLTKMLMLTVVCAPSFVFGAAVDGGNEPFPTASAGTAPKENATGCCPGFFEKVKTAAEIAADVTFAALKQAKEILAETRVILGTVATASTEAKNLAQELGLTQIVDALTPIEEMLHKGTEEYDKAKKLTQGLRKNLENDRLQRRSHEHMNLSLIHKDLIKGAGHATTLMTAFNALKEEGTSEKDYKKHARLMRKLDSIIHHVTDLTSEGRSPVKRNFDAVQLHLKKAEG